MNRDHQFSLIHASQPFGLKKLVNLAIELVLTFLSVSTPLLVADAFRLVPASAFLLDVAGAT